MGACVMLLLAENEKQKISQWLDKLCVNEAGPGEIPGMFVSPLQANHESGFIINWSTFDYNEEDYPEDLKNFDGLPILCLEYKSWDSFVGGQFALAVAQELCKRYTVLAAGWDTIGFCKDFDQCIPFRIDLKNALKQERKAEYNELLHIQKIYLEAASDVFDNENTTHIHIFERPI